MKKQANSIGLHSLKDIKPLTPAQREVYKTFNDYHLVLHGLAGTGKSLLAMYLALQRVLSSKSQYDTIYIIRSAVPTRSLGHLKGDLDDKVKEYEMPYIQLCNFMFDGVENPYEILKRQNKIKFLVTSYVRGLTLDNAIIIVDEFQNLNFHELDSIITRLGQDAKIIFSGDYEQSDLGHKEKKDVLKFLDIIEKMEDYFNYIEFDIEDVVRSGMVKDYLLAKREVLKKES